MRFGITALLCTLVAGCATSDGLGLAREARGPQPELARTMALSVDEGCIVRTRDGGAVTDRAGNPVRC
jgi:hypothetical protein